jgi:hypothetical protein
MSNSISIAVVTATLRNVLQAALNAAPPVTGSVQVITLNPADKRGTPPFVNVFLYHVTANPTLRNIDVPTRNPSGAAVHRPQAALNLHYLLTFSGDDSVFEPQRMLGTVVTTLQSQPMLTRDLITASISTLNSLSPASFSFLLTSDLASAIDLVKLTPEHLSTEELSKIWSVFFQIPYLLSVSYVASVVLLDADVSPVTPLPVTSRGAYVIAGIRPEIESVIVQSDALLPAYSPPSPIVAASPLYLRGRGFSGDDVHVLFSDFDLSIPMSDLRDDRVALTLPALQAGVTGVQVAQRVAMGAPPTAHNGTQSSVFPIIVHPQIVPPVAKANVVTTTIGAVSYEAADITVTLVPNVGPVQRVSLLLNQLVPAPAPPANAYTFEAKPRNPPASPTITFAIANVVAGTYMVRVLVDGAESVPVGGMANPFPTLVLP